MAHFLTSHLSSIHFPFGLCPSLSLLRYSLLVGKFISSSPCATTSRPIQSWSICTHSFAPTLDQFAPYIFNGQYSIFKHGPHFSLFRLFLFASLLPPLLFGVCFFGNSHNCYLALCFPFFSFYLITFPWSGVLVQDALPLGLTETLTCVRACMCVSFFFACFRSALLILCRCNI